MSAASALIAAILASMAPAPTDNGLRLGLEGVLPVHDRVSVAFAGTEAGLLVRSPSGPGKLRVWAVGLDAGGEPQAASLFLLWADHLAGPGLSTQRFFIPDDFTAGGLMLLAEFRSANGRHFTSAPIWVVFAALPTNIPLPVNAPIGIFPAGLVSTILDG